jgi:hypothetical protein
MKTRRPKSRKLRNRVSILPDGSLPSGEDSTHEVLNAMNYCPYCLRIGLCAHTEILEGACREASEADWNGANLRPLVTAEAIQGSQRQQRGKQRVSKIRDFFDMPGDGFECVEGGDESWENNECDFQGAKLSDEAVCEESELKRCA